jgi:diaminohydroxyphosphoribosylaminopyrimidine deaminase/5-amino-6-(5-phosphoribosylamino)uracil reductase
MIGFNTARVDNPLLTVRHGKAPIRPPVRIVLDSTASLAENSALVSTIADAPTWVITGDDAEAKRVSKLERKGVKVLRFKLRDKKLPLVEVLEALKAEDVASIFCEGGAAVAGGLLRVKAIDRLYLFVTPRVLGNDAVPAFRADDLKKEDDWQLRRIAQIGPDALLMLDHVHRPG